MNCPLCSTPMNPVVSAGTCIDLCPGCGGGWYDAREFAASRGADDGIEQRLRGGAALRCSCRVCGVTVGDPATPGAAHCGVVVRIRCPRCNAVMSEAETEPVAIDVCLWCGAFFLPASAVAHLRDVAPGPAPDPRGPESPTATNLGFDPSAMAQLVARAIQRLF